MYGAPGYLPALLQLITGEVASDEYTRLAAAISLKNSVKRHWTPLSGDDVRFSDDDKAYVLASIVEPTMVEEVKPVRSCLCDVGAYICEQVYPDHWEELPDRVIENVQSGDALRTHNALLLLRYIAKVYEHREREARAPLDMIIHKTFPLLQEGFAHYLELNTLEAAVNMKIILKTFWSSTQFLLPSVLADHESFFVWLDMFNALLAKPLPEAEEGLEPAGQPKDVDDRVQWPWWKAKKWAAQVASRLFARYGNTSMVEEEMLPFAETFVQRSAVPMQETFIGLLRHRAEGGFLSDRVAMLALCYLASAVEPLPTWRAMKPHVEYLIEHVIVPTLSFNASDNEVWTTDPSEYVRRTYDTMNALIDVRTQAMNLAIDMCRTRKYALPKMWGYIKAVFSNYTLQSADTRDYALKDGTMALLGGLDRQVKSSQKHFKQLETVLVQHVFPEFTSPIGFLRARAAWCFGQYGDMPFRVQHHLGQAASCLLDLFKDPDIPVRYSAATAFKHIMENDSDQIEAVVTPVFPDVIEEYFGMMGEMPVDDVVAALEYLIGRFGNLAIEFAEPLLQRLIECWRHYTEVDDDADAGVGMTPYNILDTCDTFLTAMQNAPERYAALEEIMCPVLMQLFHPSGEGLEFIDCALDIFGTIAYFTPHISPRLWEVWLQMVEAHKEFAFDYIGGMAPPTDTMIQRDTETFVTASDPSGTPFVSVCFDVAYRTIEDGNEGDATHASKLFVSILTRCVGRVDEHAPRIISYCANQLCNVAKTSYYKVAMANVLETAFMYNPMLVIATLEEGGATAAVFEAIGAVISEHKSFLTTKYAILGICSLLRVPPSELPPAVSEGVGQMFNWVVDRLMRMREIEEMRGKKDEEESNDDDDDDDDDEEEGLGFGLPDAADEEEEAEGFHDGEEATNEEDAAYLESLEEINKKIAESRAKGEHFRLDVDDDDDDPDAETPVDGINSWIFFFDTVEMWRSSPETSGALDGIVAAMAPEYNEAFQMFYTEGGNEKAQLAEEEAAQAAGAGAEA